MKVKCVVLCDSEGRSVEFSPWLSLGKVYQVLSVYKDSSGKRRFRILSNESDKGIASLGLYVESCFEVVSEFCPSNWNERTRKGGAVEIAPISWQTEGFWEELYDGDPNAYQVFDRERQLILSEEPD